MTVPTPASRTARLQVLDDETRDARVNPAAHDGISASENIWLIDFMVRLAASVRSLGRRQ